jgi:hypothetical protein
VDVLDMFEEGRTETYSGSLWLYQSTNGVTAPGAVHETIEAAEQALTEYSGLDLDFVREHVEDGIITLATKACEDNINLAVVLRVESGDVVAHAPIPDGWVPEWHPLRKQPQGGGCSTDD